jgi:hypothetical protein
MGKGSSALSRHRGFKLGQCSLSPVTRAIFENGRPWIAVWILNRVVHRSSGRSAIFRGDGLSALGRRGTLLIQLAKGFYHIS